MKIYPLLAILFFFSFCKTEPKNSRDENKSPPILEKTLTFKGITLGSKIKDTDYLRNTSLGGINFNNRNLTLADGTVYKMIYRADCKRIIPDQPKTTLDKNKRYKEWDTDTVYEQEPYIGLSPEATKNILTALIEHFGLENSCGLPNNYLYRDHLPLCKDYSAQDSGISIHLKLNECENRYVLFPEKRKLNGTYQVLLEISSSKLQIEKTKEEKAHNLKDLEGIDSKRMRRVEEIQQDF